jgi:putative ABC transport system permease protein
MGVFVLLIACINFINLSTARAMTRAREVGLRKAIGAQRGNLIRQFMGESFVMTAIALTGAAALLVVLAPPVSRLVDAPLAAALFTWETAAFLAGLAIVVGLVSGSYPAFYLSSFQPARVLKNALPGRTGGAGARSLLVVFQFGISTVLLVSSLVIFRQFDFMSRKDLGFTSEQVVKIPIYEAALKGRVEEIKAALVQQEGVRGAAAGLFSPTQYTFVHGASFEGQGPDDQTRIWWMAVDYDLLDVMQMYLVAGRSFSQDFPTDARDAYLLNETAVRTLGWNEPLDKEFSIFGPDNMGRVIGIVKDFHYQSLHHEVAPFALKLNRMAQSQLNVRLAGRDVAAELAAIESVWRQFSPDGPFEYQFLDDEIDRMYRAEVQARRLVLYFLLFSVFIACLGLFGLTAFTVEQRRKEIGIRKVLGATLPGIIALLSKDFVRLVAVAFVLAAPLAYFAMNRWLETFAYRIELSWEIWLVAGLLAVLVAMVTVGLQAARAAVADPVKSLRYE